MVADLGLTSYRFSIEWSRIEPAEGEWSRAALLHYRRIGEALLERDITPVVTFHHFTTPQWLAARGGWSEPSTADAFARFCDVAARELAPVLGRGVHDQRAEHGCVHGLRVRNVPSGAHGRGRGAARRRRLRRRAPTAVDAIKQHAPDVPVGLTVAMMDYQAAEGGEAACAAARATEDHYLDAAAGDDFIGIQTYSRMLMGPNGWLGPQPGVPVVETMFYEFWPEALEATLRRAWERTHGRSRLYVTENGLAADDDEDRIRYVQRGAGGSAAVPGRRHRRRWIHVLEPARQFRMGVRIHAAVRPGRSRPHHVRAAAEGVRALAELDRRTNAIDITPECGTVRPLRH